MAHGRSRTRRREAGQDRAVPASAQLTATGHTLSPARRRLSVSARRDELIGAALELLGSRPAAEMSMDNIAASTGTSRALVYHYFGSKQELYLAALRHAAGQLTTLLDPAPEDPPADRLGVALSRYLDYVEDHATGYVALMRGQAGAEGFANRADQVAKIVDDVRRALLNRIADALGAAAPGPALRITLRCWLACAETASLDWLERRDLARATLEEMLIAQLAALLRVAAAQDRDLEIVLERLQAGHGSDTGC